jgi:hypothetical protein
MDRARSASKDAIRAGRVDRSGRVGNQGGNQGGNRVVDRVVDRVGNNEEARS